MQIELVSIPDDKMMQALIILAGPLFGPGVKPIPINSVRKLRGGMELWGSPRQHIRAECPSVGRLLFPIMDTLPQMESPPKYSHLSYNSGKRSVPACAIWLARGALGELPQYLFSVISLSEQMPFQQTRENAIWSGADAALETCGAINFSTGKYTKSPCSLVSTYFVADMDHCDLIISIDEIRYFVLFPLFGTQAITRKLVAYAGGNSNVIPWLTVRKAKKLRTRYILRLIASAEQSALFRAPHMYISTLYNVDCDGRARLSDAEILTIAKQRKWDPSNPTLFLTNPLAV